MSLITEKIEKAIAMAEQFQLGISVMKIGIELPMVWLGESPHMIEVEIKNEFKELGWLYSQDPDAIALWKDNIGHGEHALYYIKVADLRKVAEEVFKTKQWSEQPEAGKLFRKGNAIVGYLENDIKVHPYIDQL
jgi:hypothetical protein